MLIEINGKRYPVKQVEDLELRHVAQLQYELGSGAFDSITSLRSLADIKGALGRFGNLSKAEQVEHPDGIFLTCFTVWAARRLAGEDLTLMEAISVPASSVRTIAEPADLAAAAGGGDGGGKARARHAQSVGGVRGKRTKKRKR